MSRSGPLRLRRALLGYRRSDVHALLVEEARAMDELSVRTEALEAGIVARERALAEARREADEARDAARRAADALRLIGTHLEDLDAAARSDAERIRDQARVELRAARDRVRELESVEAELIGAIEVVVRRAQALVASTAEPPSRHEPVRVLRTGSAATAEGSERGAGPGEGDREVARLDSITDELSWLSERLGGASDELDEAADLVLRQASEQAEERHDPAAGEEAPAVPGTDVPRTDVTGRIRRLEERAEAIQALAAGTAPASEESPDVPASRDGVRTLRVDVGPVEDFETLTCFMDSLDGLEGVERVMIERFSDRRAVLLVEVGGPIDLLAELTQLASVRIVERGERESGATVVDLAA